MNYLVLICKLYHLKFGSKFCTVPMKCFCIIGFYTFSGFQGYEICKFWPYRTISMIFASFCQIWKCLNQIELRWGHVVVWHWPVPVRFQD
jgi:hypothetical protein